MSFAQTLIKLIVKYQVRMIIDIEMRIVYMAKHHILTDLAAALSTTTTKVISGPCGCEMANC